MLVQLAVQPHGRSRPTTSSTRCRTRSCSARRSSAPSSSIPRRRALTARDGRLRAAGGDRLRPARSRRRVSEDARADRPARRLAHGARARRERCCSGRALARGTPAPSRSAEELGRREARRPSSCESRSSSVWPPSTLTTTNVRARRLARVEERAGRRRRRARGSTRGSCRSPWRGSDRPARRSSARSAAIAGASSSAPVSRDSRTESAESTSSEPPTATTTARTEPTRKPHCATLEQPSVEPRDRDGERAARGRATRACTARPAAASRTTSDHAAIAAIGGTGQRLMRGVSTRPTRRPTPSTTETTSGMSRVHVPTVSETCSGRSR